MPFDPIQCSGTDNLSGITAATFTDPFGPLDSSRLWFGAASGSQAHFALISVLGTENHLVFDFDLDGPLVGLIVCRRQDAPAQPPPFDKAP